MNNEDTGGKNSFQSITLLIVYLIALWVVTALWLWLGGFIALWAARYAITWLVAGLVLLSWGWITRMWLKIRWDLFSDITTKAKRLLTVIYLVYALLQLALMLLGFSLYWEDNKSE